MVDAERETYEHASRYENQPIDPLKRSEECWTLAADHGQFPGVTTFLLYTSITPASWRILSPDFLYSCLSATIGSTRIALRAGTYPATMPTATNVAMTITIVSESARESP